MSCRCGNAETQILALIDHYDVDSGSFNATVLAHYYLLAEGGSLNAITYAATGVDFAAVESTINQSIAQTVTVSGPCVLVNALALPIFAVANKHVSKAAWKFVLWVSVQVIQESMFCLKDLLQHCMLKAWSRKPVATPYCTYTKRHQTGRKYVCMCAESDRLIHPAVQDAEPGQRPVQPGPAAA